MNYKGESYKKRIKTYLINMVNREANISLMICRAYYQKLSIYSLFTQLRE